MAGPTGVYVEGLNAAKDNFDEAELRRRSTRSAARRCATLGWALAKPMKAATYSTFHAAHRRDPASCSACTSGRSRRTTSSPATSRSSPRRSPAPARRRSCRMIRKRPQRRRQALGRASGHRPPSTGASSNSAPARATRARTPSFLRTGRIAKHRQGPAASAQAAPSAGMASPSRGGIKSRSWLRPIFGSNAPRRHPVLPRHLPEAGRRGGQRHAQKVRRPAMSRISSQGSIIMISDDIDAVSAAITAATKAKPCVLTVAPATRRWSATSSCRRAPAGTRIDGMPFKVSAVGGRRDHAGGQRHQRRGDTRSAPTATLSDADVPGAVPLQLHRQQPGRRHHRRDHAVRHRPPHRRRPAGHRHVDRRRLL